METVVLSLGSNIEPRAARLQQAISLLSEHLLHINISHFYQTEPVGYTQQNEFLNISISAACALTPLELFYWLKSIETRIGRVPRKQWHEREIDIDIILFGSEIVNTPELTIPHPRYRERRFVLQPANDVAPYHIDPVSNTTIQELLAVCSDSSSVSVYTPAH